MKKVEKFIDQDGNDVYYNIPYYTDLELNDSILNNYGTNESLEHLSVPLLLNKGFVLNLQDFNDMPKYAGQFINIYSNTANKPDGMDSSLGYLYVFRPIVNDYPHQKICYVFITSENEQIYVRFYDNLRSTYTQWYKLINKDDKDPIYSTIYLHSRTNDVIVNDAGKAINVGENTTCTLHFKEYRDHIEFDLFLKLENPLSTESTYTDGSSVSPADNFTLKFSHFGSLFSDDYPLWLYTFDDYKSRIVNSYLTSALTDDNKLYIPSSYCTLWEADSGTILTLPLELNVLPGALTWTEPTINIGVPKEGIKLYGAEAHWTVYMK